MLDSLSMLFFFPFLLFSHPYENRFEKKKKSLDTSHFLMGLVQDLALDLELGLRDKSEIRLLLGFEFRVR